MTAPAASARKSVRHALAEALRLDPEAVNDDFSETVDVAGAAQLLRCTPRAIYVRHQRGQLPDTIPGARRLLWRKADLLSIRK